MYLKLETGQAYKGTIEKIYRILPCEMKQIQKKLTWHSVRYGYKQLYLLQTDWFEHLVLLKQYLKPDVNVKYFCAFSLVTDIFSSVAGLTADDIIDGTVDVTLMYEQV